MKRFLLILLSVLMLLFLCSCSGGDQKTPSNSGNSLQKTTGTSVSANGSYENGMTKKTDAMEYTLYQNLFYEKNTGDFEGKTFTKEGVFAVLEDAYNGVTRYYVWGYADNTLCCDYQWEFVMPEGMDIPESGSYVKMTGVCTKSDNALDGWWFTDVSLEVITPFSNAGYDYDLTTLSSTLVYVQTANMANFPDKFTGKTVRIFGRALSNNTVQHPYYDNNWSLDFTNENTSLSTGEYIILTGTITGSGSSCHIETDSILRAN